MSPVMCGFCDWFTTDELFFVALVSVILPMTPSMCRGFLCLLSF